MDGRMVGAAIAWKSDQMKDLQRSDWWRECIVSMLKPLVRKCGVALQLPLVEALNTVQMLRVAGVKVLVGSASLCSGGLWGVERSFSGEKGFCAAQWCFWGKLRPSAFKWAHEKHTARLWGEHVTVDACKYYASQNWWSGEDGEQMFVLQEEKVNGQVAPHSPTPSWSPASASLSLLHWWCGWERLALVLMERRSSVFLHRVWRPALSST